MTRSSAIFLCAALGLTVGAGSPSTAPRVRERASAAPLSFAPTAGVVAASASKASVLVDTADGRFLRVKRNRLGKKPLVAIADAIGELNGDRKPDLVTHYNHSFDSESCPESDGVTVCPAYVYVSLSRKNGTFRGTHQVWENEDTDVSSVALADVNGDGKPDLLIAYGGGGHGGNGVDVLLGRGDGKFDHRRHLATPGDPVAVAAVDVNGDSRRDVVAANASGTVSVILSRRGGRFAPPRNLRIGGGVTALAVGDLNGDRRPDLAVARSVVDTVTVLLNRGHGSFGAGHDYGTGDGADYGTVSEPASVAIGDLNGDGRADLVTANEISDTVSVLLNRGGGEFSARLDYSTGSAPIAVAIGSLGGRGRHDLVVPGANGIRGDPVTVLQSSPGLCNVQDVWGVQQAAATQKLAMSGCRVGSVGHAASKGFAAGRVIAQTPEAGAVLPSGAVDLTVSDGPGPGKIAPAPSLAPATSYPIPKGGEVVAIADLNGDGAPDVVTGNCGNTVSVLLSRGHGALGARQDYRLESCPDSLTLTDLNGDGRPDIVTGDDDGVISILLNRGDGTFSPRHDYPLEQGPTYGTNFVGVADLNGDGKPDLVAVNGFEADHGLSVYLGNGDGSFGPRHDYDLAPDAESIAIGALNGDGKPDLLAEGTGDLGVILNQGGDLVAAKDEYPAGGDGSNVFAADLTADGIADVVVTYPDKGTVQVLLNDGAGTLRPYVDYRTARGPTRVAIGDLNGDGTPDLAVAGRSLSILRNRGDGTFMPRRDYSMGSSPPRAVAIGDLNGDGKLDLVSVNGATVVVRLNNG